MFLLDTNVWGVYLRGKNSLVRQRLAAGSTKEIALYSVVLSELLNGTLCSAKPTKNRAAVDTLIGPSGPFCDTMLSINHAAIATPNVWHRAATSFWTAA